MGGTTGDQKTWDKLKNELVENDTGILSRSDFKNINIIDGNMVVGRTKADLGVTTEVLDLR